MAARSSSVFFFFLLSNRPFHPVPPTRCHCIEPFLVIIAVAVVVVVVFDPQAISVHDIYVVRLKARTHTLTGENARPAGKINDKKSTKKNGDEWEEVEVERKQKQQEKKETTNNRVLLIICHFDDKITKMEKKSGVTLYNQQWGVRAVSAIIRQTNTKYL